MSHKMILYTFFPSIYLLDQISDSKRGLIEESVGNDRILPERIVRLLGDAYMCFYQDPHQIDAL